jgi:hypothetical protein
MMNVEHAKGSSFSFSFVIGECTRSTRNRR